MLQKLFIHSTTWAILLLAFVVTAAAADDMAGSSFNAGGRSPENQVFQYKVQVGNDIGYLWIPDNCKRVRGLLILCPTVPEELIVGWPSIRKACAENNLGILWSVRSFWYWSGKPPAGDTSSPAIWSINSLQKMLDGLAQTSGYPEIATVPWLPMGESAHLNMVKALVDNKPERCFAAITVKNANCPQNREVPILLTEGTAQEWSQPKGDLRTSWNSVQGSYNVICGMRRDHPNWPMSELVEAGSGHFNCTNRMADYFAMYIGLAAKARLSDDGSPTLKPVNMSKGFLAPLPIPGHENAAVIPDTPDADQAAPWFFDEASAKEAQEIAHIDWTAKTQLPMVVSSSTCAVKPWSNNGVTQIDVTTSSDFSLDSVFLDSLPDGFVGAGGPLAKSSVKPVIEWLCGPMVPLGDGKFRIALDRTWKIAGIPCLIVRADAVDGIRYSNQPITVNLLENKEGNKQVISFEKVDDVRAGTISVPLSAKSDSGLPVSFYIDHGPAIVKDGKLVFTPIPPQSTFPVEVEVVAWQWGSNVDPKVQTADLAKQTFHILSP